MSEAAVIEKHEKRRVWKAPDRKLTDEEIHELVENYDYDPRYLDPDYDDGKELEPIYDRFGNPTESTVRAMYESRHNIGETISVEELFDWVDNLS